MPLDCHHEPEKGEPPKKGTITPSLDPDNRTRIKVRIEFPDLACTFYFQGWEADDFIAELSAVRAKLAPPPRTE